MSKLGPEVIGADANEGIDNSSQDVQNDNKAPSKLSALLSRRNVLFGSTALVVGSVLLATPVGATIVGSLLAKASVFSLSVVAGALTGVLGLGLLVRQYRKNKAVSKSDDSLDNGSSAEDLSENEQKDEKKDTAGCCADKKKDVNPSVVKDAPYMDELSATLAADRGQQSDSSSSSELNDDKITILPPSQAVVSNAVLDAETPAPVTFSQPPRSPRAAGTPKAAGTPQHIIFDSSSSSSSDEYSSDEYSSDAYSSDEDASPDSPRRATVKK